MLRARTKEAQSKVAAGTQGDRPLDGLIELKTCVYEHTLNGGMSS